MQEEMVVFKVDTNKVPDDGEFERWSTYMAQHLDNPWLKAMLAEQMLEGIRTQDSIRVQMAGTMLYMLAEWAQDIEGLVLVKTLIDLLLVGLPIRLGSIENAVNMAKCEAGDQFVSFSYHRKLH